MCADDPKILETELIEVEGVAGKNLEEVGKTRVQNVQGRTRC